MSIATITAAALVERFERLRRAGPVVLAFDGDGTLWSGDVAEDVFSHAVEHELLRTDAASALEQTAASFRIATGGTPSRVARDIFAAYLSGHFPEREVCEVMTWCFAGWTPAELSELADEVLELVRLRERLHRELEPVFAWAGQHNVRTVVISASPRPIVEQAARRWGIAPADIAASTAEVREGRIAPRMASPVPYAASKVDFGRQLFGAAQWLAAFGDSGFDSDMLRAAEVGVAIRPKPSLRDRSGSVPGLLELTPTSN